MAKSKEEAKNDFLSMLRDADKEQLAEFVRRKGRKPKLTKPFICLHHQDLNQQQPK